MRKRNFSRRAVFCLLLHKFLVTPLPSRPNPLRKLSSPHPRLRRKVRWAVPSYAWYTGSLVVRFGMSLSYSACIGMLSEWVRL